MMENDGARRPLVSAAHAALCRWTYADAAQRAALAMGAWARSAPVVPVSRSMRISVVAIGIEFDAGFALIREESYREWPFWWRRRWRFVFCWETCRTFAEAFNMACYFAWGVRQAKNAAAR